LIAAARLVEPGTAPRTPALHGGPGDGSYELKFLPAPDQIEGVSAWARTHLAADPHAEAWGSDTYAIRSLYLDTEPLDVYHGTPGFRRSKYRIRRYGTEELLYLEKKSKTRGWVHKQRTPISAAELPLLDEETAPQDWAGAWFHERLLRNGFRPQCQVSYRRLARVGWADGLPVRLTLDRAVRCAPASDLEAICREPGLRDELPGCVLELKFRTGLPRLFKELVNEFSLRPASSSKYRRAMGICRSLNVGA
jgi:hypothetical protein